MENKDLIYGEIEPEKFNLYVSRISAGIPYGIKADIGGELHCTSRVFGINLREDDYSYLSYEKSSIHRLLDMFSLIYRERSNQREFGYVSCELNSYPYPLIEYYYDEKKCMWVNSIVKPYLIPMSEFTEADCENIRKRLRAANIGFPITTENFKFKDDINMLWFEKLELGNCVSVPMMRIVLDYLNQYHFDYDNLIEMNMAKIATGVYKNERIQ